jgi:hypothetical protein
MRTMPRLVKRLPAVLLAASVVLTTPQSAYAISGLYLTLGLGYGATTGDELVVHEIPGSADEPDYASETCCPGHGLAAQFRLGFSIFGFAGPEFGIVGNGWNVGQGDQGGAGFVGGGVRIFPIHFFSLAGLDDESLPIDASLGVLFGWTIAGQDFAYTGTFWDVDFVFDFKLASFFSLGVKLDVVIPNYGNFVFTDYKNDRGRCTDSGEHLGEKADKKDLNCTGDGLKTNIISPQIVLTFHFDPLSSE